VLRFADDAFDASLAILTVHHWSNRSRGLSELRRVARLKVVLLTWDPAAPGFWMADYFPAMLDIDRAIFPTMGELEAHLGTLDVSVVPIHHDCSDGFMGAYWRRPEAYLDAGVRSAISTFAKLERIDEGLQRLRDDLHSGAWRRKHGEVLEKTELDLGYRLVVAG
jgi:SAM-dependent methyltransferase